MRVVKNQLLEEGRRVIGTEIEALESVRCSLDGTFGEAWPYCEKACRDLLKSRHSVILSAPGGGHAWRSWYGRSTGYRHGDKL